MSFDGGRRRCRFPSCQKRSSGIYRHLAVGLRSPSPCLCRPPSGGERCEEASKWGGEFVWLGCVAGLGPSAPLAHSSAKQERDARHGTCHDLRLLIAAELEPGTLDVRNGGGVERWQFPAEAVVSLKSLYNLPTYRTPPVASFAPTRSTDPSGDLVSLSALLSPQGETCWGPRTQGTHTVRRPGGKDVLPRLSQPQGLSGAQRTRCPRNATAKQLGPEGAIH